MRQVLKQRARGLLGLSVLGLTGCGFFVPLAGPIGTGGVASGNYAYVANAATNSLGEFQIGTTTPFLTSVTGSPLALTYSPVDVTVVPGTNLVYVAGLSGIYAYAIQTGGGLIALNTGTPVSTATVASIDVSPNGQWLVALDRNGTSIDEFSINVSTGVLTLGAGAVYGVTSPVPKQIRFSTDGNSVYAALGTAGAVSYGFNVTSGLMTAGTSLGLPAGVSMNALTVNPANTFVYIAESGSVPNGALVSGLAVFPATVNGFGSTSGTITAAGGSPQAVVLSTTGAYAYVGNNLDSTISGYTIGTTTVLTALSGSPYRTGSNVISLARDSTGGYLAAVAAGGGPDLTLYSISSTTPGTLVSVASLATGTDPVNAVAVAFTR